MSFITAVSYTHLFISFLAQKFSRLFTGLGREQHTNQRADTEANEEITHLGTNIISHGNLHKNRNIGIIRAQYGLTGMSYLDRLSGWTADSR